MSFLSRYIVQYPIVLVYMLQLFEYRGGDYLSWYKKTKRFDNVIKRGKIKYTMPAKLLLAWVTVGILLQISIGALLFGYGLAINHYLLMLLGAALALSYPWIWGYLLVLPLGLGRRLVVGPKNKKIVSDAKRIFKEHKGLKIAVAGSYGKTTMKEMLATVIGEGKKVAYTSGNMNVDVSIAKFAKTLKGDEDVVIIEFGEGEPGDVESFVNLSQPKLVVITGIAPAHLDKYPTLNSAALDIFMASEFVGEKNTFVNGDSSLAKPYIKKDMNIYSTNGVKGWKTANISIGFEGTKFDLVKDKKKLTLHSALLGEHQVGPMSVVSILAMEAGLEEKDIEKGMGQVAPYEHRMVPSNVDGAWLIDDTYNGNIDGMKAGLKLLSKLPGKRKIYVTPGLVDQGEETEKVHSELGQAIAKAKPDKVVLMNNSVTKFIESGLKTGSFTGELHIEDNPLEFYTELKHHTAHGDVVLMQNDWPDQYN